VGALVAILTWGIGRLLLDGSGQTAGLLVAAVLAGLDLCGVPAPSLFDRPTCFGWTVQGWLTWAVFNSAELALVIVTRIGFWSVWACLVLWALTDSLLAVALSGAVYGGLRGLSHIYGRAELAHPLRALDRLRAASVRRVTGAVALAGLALAIVTR
jgi:hypothetical protein